MKLVMVAVFSIVTASVPAFAQFAHYHSEYVPDAATAIAIGRAVSVPIYGKKLIQSEEPFTAMRKGGTWIVLGTLNCDPKYTCVGGTVEVTLSAKNGRVLSVIHTE